MSVVFLAARLFYRQAPIATQLVWLCAVAIQLIQAGVIYPSPSSTTFFTERLGFFTGPPIFQGVMRFFDHLWTGFFDLPTIWVLGALSFAFFLRDRRFGLALPLFQVALMIYIAIPGGATTSEALRPQRFIAVEGYCLVVMTCMV